ncbi:GTPase IMAP family member 4-like [Scleropages formosus]|uniref:Zgc:158417 n=1 Tax=Scleropages formosus TaxID=113540 RepID=A0A8C9UWV0_SCLFO|nr:GTPase IMAP family member 4-like [Scleropages formosus]
MAANLGTSWLGSKPPHDQELRMVLLGKKGAGKTSVGNIILGREEFRNEGFMCVKKKGEVAGRYLKIVDTPGWDRVEQRPPDPIRQQIIRSVSLCEPGPHAILLVIPVGKFPERERKTVVKHMDFLQDRVWKHTLVLFVCEDELRDTTIEDHIQKSGKALERLLEQCENRYHVLNISSNSRTQVTELLKKIEEIVQENCGDFYIPPVYYELIESKIPRDLREVKVMYEKREEELKQTYKRKTADLEKKLEWEKRGNELRGGLRKRRSSFDLIHPNLGGTRGPEAPAKTAEEEEQMREGGQRVDLEVVRLGYREEAMNVVTHYFKPAIVVISAVVGALIGSIGGASRGVVGSILGIPVGVTVALILAWLVRKEARAARGVPAPLSVHPTTPTTPTSPSPPS